MTVAREGAAPQEMSDRLVARENSLLLADIVAYGSSFLVFLHLPAVGMHAAVRMQLGGKIVNAQGSTTCA